jgi:hypothetical protein
MYITSNTDHIWQIQKAEETLADQEHRLAEGDATVATLQELVPARGSSATAPPSCYTSILDLSAFNSNRASYLTWQSQVEAKLWGNANHFLSERVNCDQVFLLTSALASDHLRDSQDLATGEMHFSSTREMLEFFNKRYGNPAP